MALPAAQAAPKRGAVRAAVDPEVSALKRVPGKVADVVTPKPSPEIAALAKKAEDMGIELRPDMLANNRIAKFIGEALEQVPASGSKAEQRQMAFNSALTSSARCRCCPCAGLQFMIGRIREASPTFRPREPRSSWACGASGQRT